MFQHSVQLNSVLAYSLPVTDARCVPDAIGL